MTLEIASRTAPEPLPEAVEQLLVHGDLSKLSTQQKLQYYVAQCEACGLDPRGRPFEYIQLQGKLVLYARKQCAEQLNGLHGISHVVSSINTDDKAGLIEVTVQASMGSRTTFDLGVVPIAGLKGADLANAKMKAVTKAKRRATLSLCGLGNIPDESELDTISDLRPCTSTGQLEAPKNNSGFGKGQYASEVDTEKYRVRMQAYLDKRTQEFLDFWSLRGNGELPPCIPAYEVCRIFQLDNHLAKWAIETGRLDKNSLPDGQGIQNRQIGRYTAIVYFRSKEDQGALAREARDYLDKLLGNLNERIIREHPELRSEGDLDEATDDDLDGIAEEVDGEAD